MGRAVTVESLSLWHETSGDDLTPRPGLPSSIDCDVAIVGAGFTGLWTAYYLLVADPSLRVAVLEAETAGFGASGRNGGWCSALLPVDISTGRTAAAPIRRSRPTSSAGRSAASARDSSRSPRRQRR